MSGNECVVDIDYYMRAHQATEEALYHMTAERDGLAAVIEKAPHAMDSDVSYCAVYAGEDCDCWKSATPSDVLAEVKREAWDEGRTWVDDPTPNPYAASGKAARDR